MMTWREAHTRLMQKDVVTRISWNTPGKLEKWVELAKPKDPDLPLRLATSSGTEIMNWDPSFDDMLADDWILVTELKLEA